MRKPKNTPYEKRLPSALRSAQSPPKGDAVPNTIAKSIEQLNISQIQQLISEEWLNDKDIREISPLLSEAAKAKLQQSTKRKHGTPN